MGRVRVGAVGDLVPESARLVMVEPFVTLGRASLEVFCTHVFFVFIGLALLYGQVSELHGIYAAALVAITFAGLILIALREVKQDERKTAFETVAKSATIPGVSSTMAELMVHGVVHSITRARHKLLATLLLLILELVLIVPIAVF